MSNMDSSKLIKTSERIIRKFHELDPDSMIDAEDLIIEVLMSSTFRIDKSILIYEIDDLFIEMEKKFDSNLTLACTRTILRLLKLNYFSPIQVRALATRHWYPRQILETYTELSEANIDSIMDEIAKYKKADIARREELALKQTKLKR